MRMFAGYESRSALSLAGSIALNVLALAALPAVPAQAADYYNYGSPQYGAPVAPPPQRYGEIYAPQPAYPVYPRSYRVVVYPEYPLPYGTYQVPAPPYPPVGYGGEFVDPYGYRVAEAPRKYVRPAYAGGYVYSPYRDLPYEPYGRAIDPTAPIPPGLVGPPRW
jgi:hypothetical protein